MHDDPLGDDDPLGLIDRSLDHVDIVDLLLGARELMQRFAKLALETDAHVESAIADARIVELCLGVCAVRARLLRWLSLIDAAQTQRHTSHDTYRPTAGTLLR